jgi:hypothetical protein
VTPRTLRWREDADWWLDVAAFEEAISVAERGPGDQEQTTLASPPPSPTGSTRWARCCWAGRSSGPWPTWSARCPTCIVQSSLDAGNPHSSGVYAHFISDEGAAGVQDAYGDRLKRLTALKDEYDPTNLFRMNANIPPSPPAGR